ncbi:hypothetical protein ABEB36_012213 [Hypothenemus hampei]|uniref:Uncharacterized protein n=1 Tax=Hypothenemus hampei TaxID=57062 RepID=A0ABD1EAF7_HYPHA
MNETKIIDDLPSSSRLEFHQWTNEEKGFKRKQKIFQQIQHLHIPLRHSFRFKLSKSVFGTFLQELNARQHQDPVFNENKLAIFTYQLKKYNIHDKKIVEQRNEIWRNYLELIHKAVNDCDVIDLGFLKKHLKALFLDCCFVNEMDDSVQKFGHLQVLTLCGNFLKDLPGILLPRKLVFLELFDNFLMDLKGLLRNGPRTLRHLGVGRNRLNDGSLRHLSTEHEKLPNLISLDLSDNDICDLKLTLQHFHYSCLRALSLEGNPCSVIPEYKHQILYHFPNLYYLDGVEILNDDRKIAPDSSDTSVQLTFQCYRVLGLPPPPKDKKNLDFFHVEVNFPLLQENLKPKNDILKFNPDDQQPITNKEIDKKKKNKKKNDIPSKKRKSYYARPNEYNEKSEAQNEWWKSERVSWSKILEFPTIQIGPLNKKLFKVRDTFRSLIPVRIIYLKIKSHSNKKNQKKGERKKKKKKLPEVSPLIPVVGVPLPKPKEMILKKITLTTFYCELHSLNWSDDSIDFFWADHPDIGAKAIRVNGSLKAIQYDLNTPSRKKRKSEAVIHGNSLIEITTEPLPNNLTCEVGFCLKRFIIKTNSDQ